MPVMGTIYRVLIASPSDCAAERKIFREEIYNWNAINSYSTNTILEPVMWETHSWPTLGERPQGVVNEQIVDACDFLVGAFWTRLGTPTGEADSGTAEEIERLRSAGKQIMLYFSSVPVVPGNLDSEQFEALGEYRARLQQQGLIESYVNHNEFRQLFQRNLASHMASCLASGPAAGRSETQQETDNQMATFLSRLDETIRTTHASWASEKDSGPHNIEEGQFVLSSLLQEVIALLSMVVQDPEGTVSEPLAEAAHRLRQLARHQLYIDGGRSFQAFWDGGDEVIEILETLATTIRELESDDNS